jgi:hypothetical protein
MSLHTLVVPDNFSLLDYLRQQKVVVRTSSVEKTINIYDKVRKKNDLLCIWVNSNNPLSAIDLQDGMRSVPLALWVPEIGSFKKVISKLSVLRECNLRIFLPVHKQKNLTDVRILSSLGIMCGIYFEDMGKSVNWDLIDDLLYYDVYGGVEHAPIEPFFYAVSHYDPKELLYFTTPYFDNPTQFVHIDEDFNLALSRSLLEQGVYFASGLEALDNIEANEHYIAAQRRDEHYFIENRRCAYCPAWRICRGYFEIYCKKDTDCLQFFNDVLEAVGYKRNENRKQRVWQL